MEVDTDTRRKLIEHLKRYGPTAIKTLQERYDISESTVRHHLDALEKAGWLCQEQATGKVGRPAVRYALTTACEGLFPKYYAELLNAVLSQARAEGTIGTLLDGVAETMAQELRAKLTDLEGQAKIDAMLKHLDYGDMLGRLEETEAGWELQAHNCLYHATGQKFVEVCDLLAVVINKATGLPAERPFCQRDGRRACHFLITERS